MKLLVFPHSHYYEKARWVLDHKNIVYDPIAIMPGLHMITVRRYGKRTSVPVLLDGNDAIQGSSEIIDYLEDKFPDNKLTPTGAEQLEACQALEKDMDKRLGENIRQILYARLLNYPDYIRFCFTYPMSGLKKGLFTFMYPVLKRKIHDTYVVSDEKVAKAQVEFDEALADIEKIISKQSYLLGDTFTRADTSVASMLSLLVLPKEHPFPWAEKEIPDAQIKALHDSYAKHPVAEWVRNIYCNHR
ncbi:MAG TPA: glutathione S-transferase [Cycloclasticus sp.]|jgi:glutathione S-transferase|nr:glutathione S-transferase [Cycloclasticus sp.]HIL91593.1 glutathione S-transferase [Cycloclasticus sp.]